MRTSRAEETEPVRVTTAFMRLMRLPGVTVADVDFHAAKVVVTVRLQSRKLRCPQCGFSTKYCHDTRPVASSWRHLDLGSWRLEVRADLRRLRCPTHGVRTEGVLDATLSPVPTRAAAISGWSGSAPCREWARW